MTMTYIVQESSAIHDVYNVTICRKLQVEIIFYSERGNQYSRVGDKRDYIENETITVHDLSENLHDMPPPSVVSGSTIKLSR